MSSHTAAAIHSTRPFSGSETLTLAPGTTPRWSNTARRSVTCPFAVTVNSSAIDPPSDWHTCVLRDAACGGSSG